MVAGALRVPSQWGVGEVRMAAGPHLCQLISPTTAPGLVDAWGQARGDPTTLGPLSSVILAPGQQASCLWTIPNPWSLGPDALLPAH